MGRRATKKVGVVPVEEEMMDIVVFEDENGNEIEFEIQFSFEHRAKNTRF